MILGRETASAKLESAAGAALIGAAAPTGSLTRIQRHIVKNYVEDIPSFAVGTSANAMTNATVLNTALAAGVVYNLRPGEFYKIGCRIDVPSNGGLVCDSSRKPTIYMPAANFTRANNLYATRYATNAVGIGIYGQTSGSYTPASNAILAGFMLQSEMNGDRNITGVAAQNARNLTLDDLEIFGFPLGLGINLQSVIGALLKAIWCHDFYSDTVLAALATNAPNATGIMVGGDEINNIPSTGIVIDGYRLENIRNGPHFRSANGGEQSDGLNIAATSATVTAINGVISNVGEGIDCFGSDCIFNNTQMKDLYTFGLKFIHGAQRNKASNTSITNTGLAGVVMSGSSVANQDTAGNIVTSLTVENLNANGAWSSSDSAGVLIMDNGAVNCRPRDNQVRGAQIEPGAAGKNGWLDSSTGSGNIGYDIDIKPGASQSRIVLVTNGAGKVQLKGSNAFVTNHDPSAPIPTDNQ